MTRVSPIVSVDVVLMSLIEGKLNVCLLKRDNEPFQGQFALPGGYVHPEEDDDSLAAAQRMLVGKLGCEAPYLEQLCTVADATRDPRGWSVSIAYYALINMDQLTASFKGIWKPVDSLPDLAFDHSKIVAIAESRLRSKSSYSSLPCRLLPMEFTLSELQLTYERVLETKLDKSSFRRKVEALDFVEPIPGAIKEGKHRPAQLYRLKSDTLFTRMV